MRDPLRELAHIFNLENVSYFFWLQKEICMIDDYNVLLAIWSEFLKYHSSKKEEKNRKALRALRS